MQLAIYVAAAAAALIARIFLPFLKTLFSPLRKVSGPFAARFTDLWYFLRVRNGKFHLDNIELHKKHGGSYPVCTPCYPKTVKIACTSRTYIYIFV